MSTLSLPTPSKEEPLQCPSRRLKADLVRSVIGLAALLLILILCTGIAFGLAQVLRGAHYVSHVVWTAWICWTVSALAMARYDGEHYRRHHGRSTVSRSEECGTT